MHQALHGVMKSSVFLADLRTDLEPKTAPSPYVGRAGEGVI